MVMPGLAGLMAADLGWRQAFAAIGLFVLVVGLPILFITLREPRERLAQEDGAQDQAPGGATFAQAMRSPLFWAIFAAVPVGGGALTGVFANTVTVLTSQGIAVGSATLAVTVFALVCVVIEPLAGHMLDDAARPRRTAAFFALAAAGLILLAHAHGPGMAMLGCVLTGMGLGVEFSVLPYLLARYFGLREMGAISGIAYAGALVSNGLSPLVLNAAYDRLGSYAPGLYLVSLFMVLALAVFLVLPPFDRPDQSGTSA
jgi:predicted MFS family arabinose efflux permease